MACLYSLEQNTFLKWNNSPFSPEALVEREMKVRKVVTREEKQLMSACMIFSLLPQMKPLSADQPPELKQNKALLQKRITLWLLYRFYSVSTVSSLSYHCDMFIISKFYLPTLLVTMSSLAHDKKPAWAASSHWCRETWIQCQQPFDHSGAHQWKTFSVTFSLMSHYYHPVGPPPSTLNLKTSTYPRITFWESRWISFHIFSGKRSDFTFL